LLAASLGLAATNVVGVFYLVAAVALGVWMIELSRRWAGDMSDVRAKQLFLASIIYLPVLLGAMVLDRRPFETDPLYGGFTASAEVTELMRRTAVQDPFEPTRSAGGSTVSTTSSRGDDR
ncbi:MAG: hypothetical protein ACOC0P_05915, partial [Planctomycetota bacterium]